MKKLLFILGLSTIILSACNNEDDYLCNDCDGLFSETLTIFVYEEKAPIDSTTTELCYYIQYYPLVDEENFDAYEAFNYSICGFDDTFLSGYRYELSVKRKKIGKDENSDPIYQYCLVNIIDVTKTSL
ncbi:MAG: DUF4377 domain-containing protein [Bacteroidales bacterium]|nr:DUF4377 domain-containing protein [Bacteroidales bacterium]